MFVKAVKKVQGAMFPIFRIDLVGNQNYWNVVGTGFFIDSDGVFVSVAHVFDNRRSGTDFVFCGYLPDSVETKPILIEEIIRDDAKDIFIGRIKIKTPNFLKIAEKVPEIGRSVCVAGYPLAILTTNTEGGLELGGVRRYFQPSFIIDYLKLNIMNQSGLTREHDGLLVRDFGLFGMSGGPVVDVKGTALGIQGSVTPPRISTSGDRSIVVENAVVIKSKLINELLKNNAISLSIKKKPITKKQK